MKMMLPKEWYDSKLPDEEGHEIGAGCPAVPLFGLVMSVPDSSGWWWNRHLSDPDPVCVEVYLWHRDDGSVRGGSVSYGKSINTLQEWQERGESPEWVKAIVPWPNAQAEIRGASADSLTGLAAVQQTQDHD